MKSIVLDANVFINYLKSRSDDFELLIKQAEDRGFKLFIPTAVLVEIFVGYEFVYEKERKTAQHMLENFERVDLTEGIAFIAAKIGREQKLGFIGTVDLVAAATALKLDAELATRNIKHFKDIPRLKLFDFAN